MSNPKQLRTIGIIEGYSLLMLLFIAMPIKYGLGEPIVVRIVGSVHGALFVFYVMRLLQIGSELKLSWKTTIVAGISAVLPFGFLLFDSYLTKHIWKRDSQ